MTNFLETLESTGVNQFEAATAYIWWRGICGEWGTWFDGRREHNIGHINEVKKPQLREMDTKQKTWKDL